jgi:hypothetical protein
MSKRSPSDAGLHVSGVEPELEPFPDASEFVSDGTDPGLTYHYTPPTPSVNLPTSPYGRASWSAWDSLPTERANPATLRWDTQFHESAFDAGAPPSIRRGSDELVLPSTPQSETRIAVAQVLIAAQSAIWMRGLCAARAEDVDVDISLAVDNAITARISAHPYAPPPSRAEILLSLAEEIAELSAVFQTKAAPAYDTERKRELRELSKACAPPATSHYRCSGPVDPAGYQRFLDARYARTHNKLSLLSGAHSGYKPRKALGWTYDRPTCRVLSILQASVGRLLGALERQHTVATGRRWRW